MKNNANPWKKIEQEIAKKRASIRLPVKTVKDKNMALAYLGQVPDNNQNNINEDVSEKS